MEPTSHQPHSGHTNATSSHGTTAHSSQTSPVDSSFSTTAAHATGDNPTPVAGSNSEQPASGVQTKLTNALESGKKWINESGIAEQAQQLPQKAKELGTKAWTSVSGLSTTQKAVGLGVLAAGVAFLATRGKGKKQAPEYRDRPRKSPFDHQPHTKDGDYAYERRGQRPYGTSRYGTTGAPAGKPRVNSGSGYSSEAGNSNSYGRRPASPDRGTNADTGSHTTGQRRDQGPVSGSNYDVHTSGSQNPNNLDQLNSAY